MTLTFYPHTDDVQKGSLTDRIEVLLDSAVRYKAVVLDAANVKKEAEGKKNMVPRDQIASFNWEEIAQVFRLIRELPEINSADKTKKADLLSKLAEVYEVLRGAKMSKLEAVRIALIGEANHLRGSI